MSGATWPDGSPKSLGNYFTLYSRPEPPVVPEKILRKREYAKRHYAAKQAALTAVPSRDVLEHESKPKSRAGVGFKTI